MLDPEHKDNRPLEALAIILGPGRSSRRCMALVKPFVCVQIALGPQRENQSASTSLEVFGEKRGTAVVIDHRGRVDEGQRRLEAALALVEGKQSIIERNCAFIVSENDALAHMRVESRGKSIERRGYARDVAMGGKTRSVRSFLRRTLVRAVRTAWNAPGPAFCPVCESCVRRFKPYGDPPRPDARCPICRSLERHRLFWKFFREETTLFSPPRKRMLHVAPESCLAERFQRCANIDYVSADLHVPAMLKMDLTNIPCPDASFDVVYCSHVLEHIPDDHRAMREVLRVLRSAGWAVLQVPIERRETYEDPTVVTPEDRARLFGQRDHVRVYGRDYEKRLARAGFRVEVVPYHQRFGLSERKRLGFESVFEDIYLCRRP